MSWNILVTGCAGDISQSIAKIIRTTFIGSKIYGVDTHNDHPGKIYFEECFMVSSASSTGYIHDLHSLIQKLKIDIIIPASEAELKFFLKQNITIISDVPLITANFKSLEIGFDKLKTVHFLKNEGLLFPLTFITGEITEPLIPSIIKSREGSGSKTIIKIENVKDFIFYQEKYPEFICQQYLLPDDEEYTCGLYRTLTGEIRTIIFKRKLRGGLSGSGIIVYNDQINDLLRKVAEKLDLAGSINVQLRLTDKGPYIFEINPRFSSTVLFRHLFGFSDLVWSIKERMGQPIEEHKVPGAGSKFYRISEEYIQNT